MKRFILAMSAAAVLTGSAFAGEIVRHKEVTFADLNLTSKEGVAQLHDRLVEAANEVCADNSETIGAPSFDECRKQAVKQAAFDVGSKISKRLALAQ